MRSILLLISVFVLAHSQRDKVTLQELCSERGNRRHDEDVAKMITIGESGRRFPEKTGKEFDDYCRESHALLNEINHHKDVCLKDLAKQVSSVMIYAGRSFANKLCKTKSRTRNKLLEATRCANAGSSEIQKCYTRMVDTFLGILNEKDEKKRIPFMCCEYFKFFPCMRERLERVDTCTDQRVNMLMDFVKSIVGNAVDLICGDYTDDSDKCDKLGTPPKKKRSQKRYKSFAFPMIYILDSIKDQ